MQHARRVGERAPEVLHRHGSHHPVGIALAGRPTLLLPAACGLALPLRLAWPAIATVPPGLLLATLRGSPGAPVPILQPHPVCMVGIDRMRPTHCCNISRLAPSRASVSLICVPHLACTHAHTQAQPS